MGREMQKVLIISSASIHTKKFIEMLEEESQVEVYLLTNKEDLFKDSKLKNIYVWKKNKILNIIYTFKLLKKIKPTLISIQQVGLLAFFYAFFLPRKCTILVTAWGSDIMIFPYKNWLNNILTKYTLNRANYLASIDSVGMISVMKCLSGFKKEIIPINFGVSEYTEFENDFYKKENIIYSPRNHRDLYNIEQIIHSFVQFSQKETTWKLYLSGAEDSVNTPKYKSLVKKLAIEDKVIFLGLIDQKENAQMMKKSKIVVSVPVSDGRPISVMEAIASNCIVVSSNILANHELIANNINGVIVDHTKVFDLDIIRNIDIELMTQYNRKVSQNFHYSRAKRAYRNLYKGLLDDIVNR